MKQLLTATGLLLVALGVNWAVLELFGEKSAYRAEHNLFGILLLIGYLAVFVFKTKSHIDALLIFLLALIPCYWGTVLPDWDITWCGIGCHRNPIFHSSIFYFVLHFATGVWRRKYPLLQTLVSAFGLGLASHLWLDIYDFGDVRWLPSKAMDQAWLGIHGVLCFFLPWRGLLACRITNPSQQ